MEDSKKKEKNSEEEILEEDLFGDDDVYKMLLFDHEPEEIIIEETPVDNEIPVVDEWGSMKTFLYEQCEQITKEHNISWQVLYEQTYYTLFNKYNILGENEHALSVEYNRLKNEDLTDKKLRGRVLHEYYSIFLAQNFARIFFVLDKDDPLDVKHKHASNMFPYQDSEILLGIRKGVWDVHGAINNIRLSADPLIEYRTNNTIPDAENKSHIDFVKYLLSLVKGNEQVVAGHIIPHIKDILKIYTIILSNLARHRNVCSEFRYSISRSSIEEYENAKQQVSILESNLWYTHQIIHIHNLGMIGFLDVEKMSTAGKMHVWKYLDRLTLSILRELSIFRVPLEVDIPEEKKENNKFTGDLDNDLWVASFNRFWRLELLDYLIEWIRRLKKHQKWNIPSLKFLREVIPVERKIKKLEGYEN